MTRLIDADALTKKIIVLLNLYGEETPINYVLNEIKSAPTVERPHGEWKKESAIDYLTEIGWLPEHDRILTEIPQWIPCSERLPDKIGDYIVSDIYGQVFSSTLGYVLKEKCFGYENDDRDFVKDDTVVAWMELPEPYRKDGE